MPLLRLRLLGGFQVSADGESLVAINAPRLQSLIAYLALHRGVAHTRQQLAFLLWPDSTEEQARTNLRKLLLQWRQSLSALEGCIRDGGQTLQWLTDAPATVDVAEFEGAMTGGEFERAVSLYAGDLLPDCYDEWIAPERERLSRLLADGLEKLISTLEGRRDYRGAITQAQRLLQHDPLNEATYRTLMRLHALSGNRAGALRAYQTCQQVLKREFGIEPGGETRELYSRLSRDDAFAHGQTQTTARAIPLIGRDGEWRQLLRAWDKTTSKPHCVFIAGEAGIGKTRLAEELVAWAGHQGIITATARCYAAEGALAYAPVTAWLRTDALHKAMMALDDVWLSEAARLLPELLAENPRLPPPGPLTEGWQRQRLFEALARAVLSASEPLLLLLDDAQWSDQDSLEWLRFLLRFNAHVRLMLVGTVRNEEIGDDHPLRAFQEQVQRKDCFTEIELGPLNATETAALATEVAGQALPSDRLAHLYRETEGNPLFVVETMRFQSSTEQAGGEHEPIPSSIQAVIARRLNQLTPDTRDVTGLAATIGREFTLDVLARASDRTQEAIVHSVDELLHRRIIHEHTGASDATYDFSHDKIREATYRSLSSARRQLFHRRVAEALEQIDAANLDMVSGQIAAHYELAGLAEQAVDHYQRAAQAARRIYANTDAIRYYQRAQRLLEELMHMKPGLAASASALNESLGDVLFHVTQHADALNAYRRALTSADRANHRGIARLYRKIGNALRDQREYSPAEQAYASAEHSLDDPQSSGADPDGWQEWIQVHLEMDALYYWLGRVRESGELLARLQPVVEQHGTPSQRAEFFRSLAFRLFRQNRSVATEESVTYIKAALDAFVEMEDQAHIPAATFGLGFALLWHGEPEQAEQPFLEALHMAERTGDASLVARCVTYLTAVYRQLGQLELVRQFVARSYQAAEAAGMPEYTAQANANAAWLAWRDEDWPGVQHHGQAAVAIWQQLPGGHASMPFQWLALCPLMAVSLREGDMTGAVNYVRMLLDPRLQRLPDALTGVLEQAVQAWDADQSEVARNWLNQAVTLAQHFRLL